MVRGNTRQPEQRRPRRPEQQPPQQESPGRQPPELPAKAQLLGTLLLGALLVLSGSQMLPFLLIGGLWLLFAYLTLVRNHVSAGTVATTFAAAGGVALLAFQPPAILFGLVSVPASKLMNATGFSIFLICVLVALYYAQRLQVRAFKTILLPYILALLWLPWKTLQVREALRAAGSGTGILGAQLPNHCLSETTSLLCTLCTVTGIGEAQNMFCYYKALSLLGIVVTGIFAGYMYAQQKSVARKVGTVLVVLISGWLYFVFLINLL